MSAELNELAAKVEALSGPDRRVDCAIFATVYPDKFGDSAAMYARIDWTRNRADWMWLRDLGMPAYTASIDAAMTLVTEGLAWSLNGGDPSCLDSAEIGPVPARGALLNPQWTADGATPALALTAAALRARSLATSQ